jgi:hypothetical protein
VLALEGAHRLLRPGAGDPVDRMGIEAERAHRHLKSGDIATARIGLRRKGEERCCDHPEQGEELGPSRWHGTQVALRRRPGVCESLQAG